MGRHSAPRDWLADRDIGHNVVPPSPDQTPAAEIPFWTALAKIYHHGGWLILAIALMIAPWITWLLLKS